MRQLLFVCLLAALAVGLRTRCARPVRTLALHMSDDPVAALSSVRAQGDVVLKATGLSKAYTGEPQFRDISFNLQKGIRVGLIGVNGAGKSTLLKCLSKSMNPDEGSIETAANANIILCEQEPEWGDKMVYEALFAGQGEMAVAARLYFQSMDPAHSEDEALLARALDLMSTANAWDYQQEGLSIAEKLNIDSDFMYRRLKTMSGGEKKRVGLSASLLQKPDVLLLDEPTNHLDADALDWLSDYLKPGGKDKDMTMLLVTHDRYFLERTCSEILELDRASIYRYPGNYGRYLEMKAARIAAEDAEADRARTKLRRESEWMAKQPRARQAKSKARQAQFYELVDAAKGREVQGQVSLSTPEEKEKQRRLGGVVAEFKKASYAMGADKVLLQDFTYSFRQRDRIAIVGANGAGKSTFLKVLTGQLRLSGGEMRLGETARVGYYDQVGLNLTPDQEKMPVLKFVQEAVEKGAPQSTLKAANPKIVVQEQDVKGRRNVIAGKAGSVNVQVTNEISTSTAVSERDAMQLLQRFQFPSKRFYDRVGQLSGGERRRLQLLQVLASQPNVLLLDEPSNDLDISTLQALEEYLTEVYEGCLVVVSHDNFFVNRVAEHLFVFEGKGVVRDFQGSYTEYLEYRMDVAQTKREEEQARKKENSAAVATKKPAAAVAATAAVPAAEKEKGPGLSYNERKEYNKLETEIAKVGKQIKVCEDKIGAADNSAGFSVLAKDFEELNKLREALQVKEARFLELMFKL